MGEWEGMGKRLQGRAITRGKVLKDPQQLIWHMGQRGHCGQRSSLSQGVKMGNCFGHEGSAVV